MVKKVAGAIPIRAGELEDPRYETNAVDLAQGTGHRGMLSVEGVKKLRVWFEPWETQGAKETARYLKKGDTFFMTDQLENDLRQYQLI